MVLFWLAGAEEALIFLGEMPLSSQLGITCPASGRAVAEDPCWRQQRGSASKLKLSFLFLAGRDMQKKL